MGNEKGPKVPKKVMGFKLSKGTRKDVKKMLEMLADPDKKDLAISAAGGLAAFLAERVVENQFARHAKGARVH